MPKIYNLPRVLSLRVASALTSRLRSFMAAMEAERRAEQALREENEREAAEPRGTEAPKEYTEEEEEELPGDGEERERSRSPRQAMLGIPVLTPDPSGPAHILSACSSVAVGLTSAVAGVKESTAQVASLTTGAAIPRRHSAEHGNTL